MKIRNKKKDGLDLTMMPNPRPAQTKMSRRTFLKRGAWTLAGMAALCAAPFYAHHVERTRVETVKLELAFADLPDSFDGMTLLHFSDLHYGFYYGLEQLGPLVSHIQALKPDMIVFTGDLFDKDVLPFVDECTAALRPLTAPLGKWAVPGNHDYYTGWTLAPQFYEQCGFDLLANRSDRIRRGEDVLQIAGIDDLLLGKPDLAKAFAGLDSRRFTLLLSHQPDIADRTNAWRVDLQLSGHSHGGQVRLPVIGEVLTPPGGSKYVLGLYELTGRGTESYVYTNRGIGTTHIPVRFLCRPELTLFTLRKKR